VAFGHPRGLALEVFGVRDHFERLATPDGRNDAATKIAETLRGELALEEQLDARSRRYRPKSPTTDRDVRVLVDTDA